MRHAAEAIGADVVSTAFHCQESEPRSGPRQAFPEVPVHFPPQQFVEAPDLFQQTTAMGDSHGNHRVVQKKVHSRPPGIPCLDALHLQFAPSLREMGKVRAVSRATAVCRFTDDIVAEHQDIRFVMMPHHRLQVAGKVLIVVVEIRDHLPGGRPQGHVSRRADAAVLAAASDANSRVALRPAPQHPIAAVAGLVVDGKHFPVGKRLPDDGADRALDQRGAVVDRHDDRNRSGHAKSPPQSCPLYLGLAIVNVPSPPPATDRRATWTRRPAPRRPLAKGSIAATWLPPAAEVSADKPRRPYGTSGGPGWTKTFSKNSR